MNEILYTACAALTDEDRKKARPVFGSIHATSTTSSWATASGWRGLRKAAPSTNLDAILFEDFGDLSAARRDGCAHLRCRPIAASWLNGTFEYLNNSGKACADPAAVLLAHFFNHQTHHRGQVHALLSDTPVAPPPMDLHRVVLG